ncbi:ABC transporter ATP-binding protein [Siccirubricoccus deserti]|uniref:ABC transporter ATP-binding protein n=1 Tax=Siccirubricoccus deserti TaxID=2013562 RepID=A0A9X0QYZ8_9PROT|nr:ABC transporter ATP-binding protein [Siccirubricoccus deserti]MBC4016459.1 ABC transporter ATP-binding protein [Siccirubricoccus deserti]
MREIPVLEVKDLRTVFLTDAGPVRAVDGVSFTVMPGETLGIVGESGSGKSVTALSLLRLLEEPARIVGGSIRFQGRDLLAMDQEALRALRGDRISMVFQDPMTGLNPVVRILRQLTEHMVAHGRATPAEAKSRAISLLGRMGITAPERSAARFPHEFSGGMRQRVMLGIGFANDPALLIADEPTTALDVTIQAQILDLLRRLNGEFGTAIVLISHDLGVIADVCRRVAVMYAGEVVEEAGTAAVLADPRHPYAWALVNAVPRIGTPLGTDRRLVAIEGAPPDPLALPAGCRFAPRCPFRIARCETEHPPLAEVAPGRLARCWVTQAGEVLPKAGVAGFVGTARIPVATQPILSVRGLEKRFPLPRESLLAPRRVVHAVNGIDLDVARGETLGVVGESGCGKSTLARLITRIHAPSAGSIVFDGQEIGQASAAEIRPLRRRLQMVFQDPYASLNPRMRVGDILAEPLIAHGLIGRGAAARERVTELLATVGLNPAWATRCPHEFSGGQRQRISIARALALQPDMILADEPISALDVNIQAQILNLMLDLQQRMGLTYLFIAHDLAVVRHLCDRVAVLYLGKVMELAPSAELFARPLHPYSSVLISAVPGRAGRILLQGEPPSTLAKPTGCPFRGRCPIARPICETPPPLVEHAPGCFAACHFPGEFAPPPSP